MRRDALPCASMVRASYGQRPHGARSNGIGNVLDGAFLHLLPGCGNFFLAFRQLAACFQFVGAGLAFVLQGLDALNTIASAFSALASSSPVKMPRATSLVMSMSRLVVWLSCWSRPSLELKVSIVARFPGVFNVVKIGLRRLHSAGGNAFDVVKCGVIDQGTYFYSSGNRPRISPVPLSRRKRGL